MRRIRETGDAVDVIITPERGRVKEIAQLLLGLADHPNQVKPVSWPTTGFQVSKELFDEFEAAMAELAEAYGEKASGGIITSPKLALIGETDVEVVEPIRKPRGRPKKVVDAPDIAEAGGK